MNTVKLYLSAVADLAIILIAALADFDMPLRILTGCAGMVLAVLTSIKFIHDIRLKRKDSKLKDIELKRKEEEFRRFMEKKYN